MKNYPYKFTKNVENILRWDSPHLLLDRDFLFLWLSQMFTLVGGGILGLSVAFLVDQGELVDEGVSTSGSAMGLVIFLNNFPSFFVASMAGVLADWFDRKMIMFSMNLLRFFLLLIFLVFKGWEVAIFAYGLIFLKSVAKQIFIPSEASIIPDIVQKKNILPANTIFNLTNYLTYLVGFIIAGPLLKTLGPENLIISLGAMFLFGSFAILLVRVPEKSPENTLNIGKFFSLIKSFNTSFLEGLRYMYRDKIQRIALIHNLIAQSCLYIFIALIFKLGEFMINLTPSNIGLAATLPIGIGILVGIILMQTKFKDYKRFYISTIGVVIETIAFAALSIGAMIRFHDKEYLGFSADSSVLFITIIGVILIGFGFPLLIIPSQALVQERTKQGFLGRVYGIWLSLSQAIASIPALIIGYVADFVVGVPTTLVWLTILGFIYGTFIFRYRKLA